METLLQDLRYGLRMLLKSPGFTAAVVLSLAIGIGANTAIFSLINAVMLKMLPVENPEQLVLLGSQNKEGGEPDYSFYYPVYRALRDQNQFFTDLAAFAPVPLNVSIDGVSEPMVPGELVSGSYFSVLGVNAIAGRNISLDDDRVPGGHPVAMISYSYWNRRFALAPTAIGKAIQIDGTPFTIIGVTSPRFFGVEVGSRPDIMVPLMMQPQVMPATGSWLGRPVNVANWLHLAGRLMPGVTTNRALAEMNVVYQRIMAEEAAKIDAPWAKSWLNERLILASGGRGLSQLRRQFSQPLFILMTVVGLVLLTACANVANLLLARATARRREIAVRLAIGAGRGRLIQQLFTESLMLAVMGGVAGLLMAAWASELLLGFMSQGRMAIVLDLTPDFRVFAFTTTLSVLTAVFFGLTPALRATRLDLASALKQTVGRIQTSRSSLRTGKVLVVSQVALSLLLMISAGLFVRTLQKLNSQQSGYEPEHLLTVRVEPKGSDQKRGENAIRLNHMYTRLQERVAAIPGILSASLAGISPTSQISPNRRLRTPSGEAVNAHMVPVLPKYFATLGIPILYGRDFTPAEMAPDAPYVAIINESLASSAFSGQNAVGMKLRFGASGPFCQVIGVVKDANYGNFRGAASSGIYQPFLQANTGRGQMYLHVRVAKQTDALLRQVQAEVQAVDKEMPAFQVRTLATELDAALIQERLIATLSGLFGLVALLLAAIGLYGILAYAVTRRTSEIGIRMALGARGTHVIWMVMQETLLMVTAGIVSGLFLAAAATRLISSMLFGLTPMDPMTFAGATFLMTIVAVFAGYLPARRASQIDPLVALRHE